MLNPNLCPDASLINTLEDFRPPARSRKLSSSRSTSMKPNGTARLPSRASQTKTRQPTRSSSRTPSRTSSGRSRQETGLSARKPS